MHFLTPSKKVGPNLKPDSGRFLSEFSKTGPTHLQQQMTEKIAVEVGAKNRFEKKFKNRQKSFFQCIF